jgi:hypothetical protein
MRLRNLLRSAEFRLPPSVARACFLLISNRYPAYRREDDMMRAIFIHVPKAAGSSVCAALFAARPRHVPLSRYLAIDPDRFARYLKFGFVRNPWDRMHSAYIYLLRSIGQSNDSDGPWATRHLSAHPTFESFVHALDDGRFRRLILGSIHFRPQAHWMRIPGSKDIRCDYVGRFEHLVADFEEICRKLGVERKLPILRTSEHVPYQTVYSQRMIERVAELYADDIQVFGYGFDRTASTAIVHPTAKRPDTKIVQADRQS